VPGLALFQPLFCTSKVSQPFAPDTTQDHAFIDAIPILGQAEHAVDVVHFVAASDLVECEVLPASPGIGRQRKNGRLSRSNAPWNSIRSQHRGRT
jgi:hypothetical protein